MKIREYLKPTTLEEAYNVLKDKNATVIGGGAYLRLGAKNVDTMLDLSNLGLDLIDDKENRIEIGAMVTLRQVEQSEVLQRNFSGAASKAIGAIMGVQTRNIATVGGSVAGRYAFSDVITPLLALDTYVQLYKGGEMSIKEFLDKKGKIGDIITKIIIMKDDRKASFQSVRNTSTDFSILNTAASNVGGDFKISVGARPGVAQLAEKAMEFLKTSEINEEAAIKAGEIAAEELKFGNDIRGSLEYRTELCKTLVKRAILEVM